MDLPTIHPRALSRGDTIGIIAPAGTVRQRVSLTQGVAVLNRMGFDVRYDDRIFHSLRYLAGDDASRAAELHSYFEDPAIHAVLCLRGGFGCSRLISMLDEKRLRHHCKIFMGFSDITTLHLYFRRRLGWVTIHGPMAASNSLGQIGSEAEQHLRSLLTDPGYVPRMTFPGLQSWYPGIAEGKVTGGCLSIIAASLGTSYEVRTEGKILFLEDLGEEPYRLDRMLTQLSLAGKLDGIAGILLGSFPNCDAEEGDCTAEDTLRDILVPLQVPVLAGFPAGHGPDNWAFPLGVTARLDAGAQTVEFLQPAVF
jgi:muramoyltetrapeptide carboxypeptidase